MNPKIERIKLQRMVSRSAEATIKGYYYQFDTTILKLVQLSSNTDAVTIEGIEDIDINTINESETIQCKYLSKPNFTNSTVREPITLMLAHFISVTTVNNLKYTLYAHFENEIPGNEPAIDLPKLKEILTHKEGKALKCYHRDNGISDAQLTRFIAQFKLKFGIEFDQQQKQTLAELKKHFKCTDFEADSFFYNNALRVVIDRAKMKEERKRTITKAEFIAAIDSSGKLFNEWYIRLRTKKEYLRQVKDFLTRTKALAPSRSKCIIVGNELLQANNDGLPPIAFIESLLDKYYKPGHALRNAVPLTLVLDLDNHSLLEMKKELLARGIDFNDGQEHIRFTPSYFNKEPVVNLNRNATKILHASSVIRIVSLHSFISNLSSINKPKVVLHFSKAECPYARTDQFQWFDIKYCGDLSDISHLIL